jgi:hypothetical protein
MPLLTNKSPSTIYGKRKIHIQPPRLVLKHKKAKFTSSHSTSLRFLFFSMTRHCQGFTITLRYTTDSRNILDEWSAWRQKLYLTTYNTHNRQAYITPVGFESAIQQARAKADPRLRPRGDWDRHCFEIHFTIILPWESRWPNDFFKFRYKVGRFFLF